MLCIQGLFQLFWEKAPGLNWGKNMRHFGNFLEVLNSKNKKKLNMCMIYSCVYERVISYKCNHLYWGCNITSCFCKITWLCMSCFQIIIFWTISEVSISIASSSELLSLLAVADLDGGSTYGQEKDLASCVSDDPWKKHTVGQKRCVFFQMSQSGPFYRKFLRASCGHITNDQLSDC